MCLKYFPIAIVFETSFSKGKSYWKEIIKFSFPLIAVAILTFINNFTDRYVITHFVGLEYLASYAAVYSLAAISSLFYSTLGFSLFPELSKNWDNSSKKQRGKLISQALILYLFFQAPFMLGLSIIGPFLINVLTSGSITANLFIYIGLGLNIGMFGLFQIFWYAILLGFGSSKGLSLMFKSALVNFGLNIALVPIIGLAGAITAGLVSNTLLVFLSYRIMIKCIELSIPWKVFTNILSRALLLGFFLIVSISFMDYTKVPNLIFGIFFTAIVYISFDLLRSNKSILRGFI